MKNKNTTTPSIPPLAVTITALMLLVFTQGCNNPVFYHRPSDQACMTFLTGKRIVLEKGLITNRGWVIEAGEFTAFSLESVTKHKDGTRTARVKFELKSSGRILRVEADLLYRHHKKDNYVEFLDWTITRLLRLGVW